MYNLRQYPHLKPDGEGKLLIDGFPYLELAGNYGTPLYVYSLKRVEENCVKIKRVLDNSGFKNKIFYSYKTNLHSVICKLIHKNGFGAEITSDLELQGALNNGLSPHMIIYDGPYKSENSLIQAINAGVKLINADSLEELKQINNIAGSIGLEQEVGITLKSVENSKIGVSFSETEYSRLKSYVKKLGNINITTLHRHMRTQNNDLTSYLENLKSMINLADTLKFKAGCEINKFDLGGGLPEAAIIRKNIDGLSDMLRTHGEKISSPIELYFEPGRFIVGDSGVLITRILKIKQANGRKWLIIDAGSNILSPLAKANYRFIAANMLFKKHSTEYSIGGPLPASFDVLTRSYPLPEGLAENDFLAILNVGAYCQSFSIDFGDKKTTSIFIDGKAQIKFP